MGDPKLWVNIDGKVVHPDAPLGDGGPGHFRSATPVGSDDNRVRSVPDPFSPEGRNVVFDAKQQQKILADAGGSGAPPSTVPAITVSNGWASPSGDQARTTVGIGELSSLTVSDVAGGRWKSADGKGTTANSVTFVWTASAVGTNTITYTAANGSVSSVTMTTIAPQSLSGKKDSEITTYAAGTQGAGMNPTITVLPTTVSFQALEIMEDVCGASTAQRLLHHARSASPRRRPWRRRLEHGRPEERRLRHRRQLWTAFALGARQLHLGHPDPLAQDWGPNTGDRVQRHQQ